MKLTLFTFFPDGGPAFEVWAPQEMHRVDAPESAGALVAGETGGFAPNLVLGHNRVSADMTLEALAARLEADAGQLPGSEPLAGRTVAGTAGEIRIVAFTRAGPEDRGPLYQMTACLLAPSPALNGERAGDFSALSGERATDFSALNGERAGAQGASSGERDLIYLTGTCTVEQMPTWEAAFVDAARSVRLG